MSDLVRVPKYSHFRVVRIGKEIAIQCVRHYNDPGGKTLNLTVHFDATELAFEFEDLFNHLFLCSQVCDGISEDVMQQTIQLMKGTET